MTHIPLPGTVTFQGRIGRTHEDSVPWRPEPDAALPGSPSVIYVVLDDVGLADLGCYGSEIRTPHIGGAAGSPDVPAVPPPFHGRHGLHLGADRLSPVSASYPGTFPFTGRLEKVVFNLSKSEETALFEAED
ncbi:hypothetical protein FQ154_14995 [Paeniglutamicibacter gangotriensis]|uniref:Uncharacterized protein n=1 Tax=Paeniglutamicibacter gangotriensis TaxID=254787 RepID=A0A5B0E9D8_9MICC|nr:hypothetical protein [Paeniglutamicibacter gangotriensis]KAA0974795.1 hypothetical protein FQ154_14995 [Paeniglutamicibacter gangotriensis]